MLVTTDPRQRALLLCSNSPSWPSRSRGRVSVVTHDSELAKPDKMPRLCCSTLALTDGQAGRDAVSPLQQHTSTLEQ